MNDGDLEVGNRADICVFDESENWIINSSNLKTNARNNPLYGYEIKGRVQQTIVDGKCIYNKEKETG